MRKHFYLITEHRDADRVGLVEVTDTRKAMAEKNVAVTGRKRDLDSGEVYTYRYVSLGYVDFDDEADYEENAGAATRRKLSEIDEQHLADAGVDPKEVLSA